MKKQLFAIVLILSYRLNGVGTHVASPKPKPSSPSSAKPAVYNPMPSIPLTYSIVSIFIDSDNSDIYTCDHNSTIPTTGDYSFDSFSGTSLNVTRKFSSPPRKSVSVRKFTLNNCTKKTIDDLPLRTSDDLSLRTSPYLGFRHDEPENNQDGRINVNSGNGRKE